MVAGGFAASIAVLFTLPRPALAQFKDGPPPPAIPDPPWLEHVLFESPWGAAVVLVLMGAAGFWALNRAGKARQGVMSFAAGAVLAGALAITAALVTTDREIVSASTRELVAAVGRGDGAGVGALLDPGVTVRVLGLPRDWDAADIKSRVSRDLGPGGVYRLKDGDARVRTLRASSDSPSVIRTQCRVWVQPEQFLPTTSWWVLTWRKSGSGGASAWRVTEIDIEQIEGMAGRVPSGL